MCTKSTLTRLYSFSLIEQKVDWTRLAYQLPKWRKVERWLLTVARFTINFHRHWTLNIFFVFSCLHYLPKISRVLFSFYFFCFVLFRCLFHSQRRQPIPIPTLMASSSDRLPNHPHTLLVCYYLFGCYFSLSFSLLFLDGYSDPTTIRFSYSLTPPLPLLICV